ncbi:MAG TPA: protein kinase, partial [Pyrinomonadaceae bacterium]
MSLVTGTKLGRYEIRSKIGEGGMGEVYLAQDTKLDRKIALKILPAEVAAHPDRMKRFVQEAKAASALNHPNIITIYEIDETESGHFIATEFIDGETPGKGGEAKKAIDELKQSSKQRYVSSYYLALIYAALGEKNLAFEWLENAYKERSDLLIYLKVDPRLDSLRSDARFTDLIRR